MNNLLTFKYYFNKNLKHFLNNPECSKHYKDNKLTVLTKGRIIYYLNVL